MSNLHVHILFSVSVRALLKVYNWEHVSIIYDVWEVFYREAGPSMTLDFEEDEDFPPAYPVPFNQMHQWNAEDVLTDASKHARGRKDQSAIDRKLKPHKGSQ